jgi:hypothetical protein
MVDDDPGAANTRVLWTPRNRVYRSAVPSSTEKELTMKRFTGKAIAAVVALCVVSGPIAATATAKDKTPTHAKKKKGKKKKKPGQVGLHLR